MTFYKGNISSVTEKVMTQTSTSTSTSTAGFLSTTTETKHNAKHFIEKTFKLDGKTFLFNQAGTQSLLLEENDLIAVKSYDSPNKNGYYCAETIVNISKNYCVGGKQDTMIKMIFQIIVSIPVALIIYLIMASIFNSVIITAIIVLIFTIIFILFCISERKEYLQFIDYSKQL